jgi:PilZ domain
VEEHKSFRNFGYRSPRIGFPLSLRVEIARSGEHCSVGVRGIDISGSGIAVAVFDEVPLAECVELVIRHEGEEVARVPGRVFYQSDDHCGIEFQFGTDEQRLKVQELLAHFLATV